MKRLTEKDLAARIGKNIVRYRKIKGFTSEGLAFEIDKSKSYMSEIENSKKLPSIPMLILIANALEVDVSDLLK